MFVSFGILFIILAKFAWPAIMKGMTERANFIDKGVEYAQEAKTQLDGAREEARVLSKRLVGSRPTSSVTPTR